MQFHAIIKKGSKKDTVYRERDMVNYIASLGRDDKDVEITYDIYKRKRKRSNDQNAYYWLLLETARDRMTQLRAEIQHLGADGLEEQRDQLRVQHAALTQRVDQFKRQLDVLSHLLDILDRRRAVLALAPFDGPEVQAPFDPATAEAPKSLAVTARAKPAARARDDGQGSLF